MTELSPLCKKLETTVLARTGKRLRDLAIQVSPERIVLQGQTNTYYVKQLAQQGIREVLPHVHLENAIVVHG